MEGSRLAAAHGRRNPTEGRAAALVDASLQVPDFGANEDEDVHVVARDTKICCATGVCERDPHRNPMNLSI